jgi:hypothetical protein
MRNGQLIGATIEASPVDEPIRIPGAIGLPHLADSGFTMRSRPIAGGPRMALAQNDERELEAAA